jgi:hypothetical protein
MWRTFLRWTAPLFVAGTCLLPLAHGQRSGGEIDRGVGNVRRELSEEEKAARVFALPYAVATVVFLIVMVIVCTPSRKMLRED